MTESINNDVKPKAEIQYMLITLPKQDIKLIDPIDENKLDHSYCVNMKRLSKERRNCIISLLNKTDNVDINKVAVDCTQNSIVEEEIIIPDLTEENINQNIHLDTLCSQIPETKYTQRDNETLVPRKTIQKIHAPDEIKSYSKLNLNTSPALRNNLKFLDNTIVTRQNTIQIQAKTRPVNNPIEITLEQYYNLSVLKSGNTQIPSILKLPISKPIQNKTVIQTDNLEMDKSTVHVLNAKEKQIAIADNHFIEIKEVVETDSEEQIANRNKRFYHTVCLTCKKLKKPDDTSSRCRVCQNIFQYECLRCRDILSSKDEYFNHLKMKEFCPEIRVPLLLKNDSYALATVMERNQCTSVVWERAQKLASVVKVARTKSINGKFKRIKLCCPICDDTFPIDSGNFWCATCDVSSVFRCQTCSRNYTTYCGAIYHTENHLIRMPIYECYECSFKHKKKRALFTHIRHKHLQKESQKMKPRNKVAQCPDCNLIITNKSYWMKHKYSCRKKVYFKCTLCTEKYLAKEEMRLHLLAAHEKTDSQALDLIKKIEGDRNNQEKMKERKQKRLNRVREEEPPKKQKNNENNNKPKLHYITPYCINCNKTYEHLKISNNNNCPKCKSTVGVQCKFCKKSFDKYMTAYYHITKKCEKIKKAQLKERNGGSLGKASKKREHKIVIENTNRKDLSNNSECSDFISEDLLESNSTFIEDSEMDLNTDIDIKLETLDVKIFNSPALNLDEVFPDKVVN